MALSNVYPATLAGARFEETSTEAKFSVGTVCIDNCGGQWLYVKAAATTPIYSLVNVTNASIILGTWLVELTTTTTIATGPKFLGIAQIAFAASEYGWIWRGPGGGLGRGIKVLAENATAGALLTTLASPAGSVDDANVDEGVLAGLTTLVTTTTNAATECQASTIIACNLTEVD